MENDQAQAKINQEPVSPVPSENNQIHQTSSYPTNEMPQETKPIRKIEKFSAWVVIFSASLFALIEISFIWGVFGHNTNVEWKSALSLGVIVITALVVNVGAHIYDGERKHK